MKKILFYIYSLNKGGAERVLLTIAEKLNRDKNLEIVILTDTVDEREYNLPEGIRRVNVSDYMFKGVLSELGPINRLFAIRRCCKKERPDKIVAFMLSSAIRAITANLFTQNKVIAAVRSNPYDDFGEEPKRENLLRTFSKAEKIVCQTEYQKQFFTEYKNDKYGLSDKCEVIFNPIFDDFTKEPYCGQRDNVIVATGRLFDYKNHKMLIRAFAKIAPNFPYTKLIIYGEGPYRKELEAEINSLNNKSRILLPGDSSQVAEDIKKALIYVLPSDTEGMPNALMEAMAMGLPCVSTDCPCGGPKSLIQDGVNGRLVPVGDTDKLAEVLEELLLNDKKRERLSKEALKIREICNSDKITSEWRKILEV